MGGLSAQRGVIRNELDGTYEAEMQFAVEAPGGLVTAIVKFKISFEESRITFLVNDKRVEMDRHEVMPNQLAHPTITAIREIIKSVIKTGTQARSVALVSHRLTTRKAWLKANVIRF